MPRFRPRDLRHADLAELRRQLNEIQKEISSDIDLVSRKGRVTELVLTDYAASFGDVVRMAPPSSGARLILPAPLPGRVGEHVTLTVEAETGAVTVEVVDGTINGEETLVYPIGIFAAEFVLTPDGWFTSLDASQALDDAEYVLGAANPDLPNGRVATSSTSVTVITSVAGQIQWHRVALTGDVTALANSNATTIANDAVTNAKAANMAANTIKANATASTADPADLAISANNFPARIGGNLVSHPFSTLAGAGLDYATGALAVSVDTDADIDLSASEQLQFRKSPGSSWWFEDFDFINATGAISTTGSTVNFQNTNWYALATTTAGAISRQPASANHPGVIAITTGATDNNRLSLFNGTGGTLGDASYRADQIGQIEFCFSISATSSIAFFVGFTDGASFTNAILFTYDTDAADTNVQTQTFEGGVNTKKDTGIAPGTGFRRYTIRQTSTTIEFSIDGNPVTTHTKASENVPDSEPGCIGFVVIARSAAVRSLNIDYAMFETLTLAR